MSSLSRQRRATRIALIYFALSAAALVWPIYPWLGNHIEPRIILGLPWSLTWVLLVITANFAALALLYRLRLVDDREHEDEGETGGAP